MITFDVQGRAEMPRRDAAVAEEVQDRREHRRRRRDVEQPLQVAPELALDRVDDGPPAGRTPRPSSYPPATYVVCAATRSHTSAFSSRRENSLMASAASPRNSSSGIGFRP
jgi:hypothetical protein